MEINGQFPGTDHDQIKVTGSVSLNGAVLNLIGGYANATTNVIILIDNDGTDPINGAFADLPEGSAINFGAFSGLISYEAGDGNDVALLGNPEPPMLDLIITEIMYNPGGVDTNWEWIEVYNSGFGPIDLSGYVLDDDQGTPLDEANILSGTIAPQESAVLFNTTNITIEQFKEVWGNVNAVGVVNWPSLGNGGDTIGLWDSFSGYDGDQDNQLNSVESVTYDSGEEGWPADENNGSIFLIALEFDNSEGVSWSLSSIVEGEVETPLFNSYMSKELHGNSGSDIGSPGPPDEVLDEEAPVIICPDAVVVLTNEDGCDANFSLPIPEVSDNVSTSENILISITRSDGLDIDAPYMINETILTITATDEAGNTSEECMVTITVNDEQAPEISCDADISIIGSGPEILIINPPTVTDNCTTEPSVIFVRSDDATLTLEDPFPQGVTTITWSALDDANNMSACSQTVTISIGQSMANNITNFGIPDQLPGTDIDSEAKTVNLTMPIGTDLNGLFPNVTISEGASVSPETGVSQDFSEPIVYTVTAEDGTIQEWTVIVNIEEDIEPPVVECPDDIVVSNDPGECGAIVEFTPSATDNSGSATVSADFMSGSVFPVGTTLVTVIATDLSGNMATCSFNVTVNDEELPTLVCSADISVISEDGNPMEIAIDGPEFNDNCALQPDLMGVRDDELDLNDPFPLGTTTITWSISDLAGNVGACEQVVTIAPFEMPVLTITSFTLIDADTDEPIKELVEGETIDINDLPTLHLDIRANTTEDVESVRLSLAGALMTERTESLMPFALFQDLPIGDYMGADFVLGQYAVSGTPYSQDGLGGEMGEPLTLNFELIDSTPTLAVTGFTLINADTDEPLFELTEGQQIDINSLPTTNLDIRANTTDDVESVRISISGGLMNERTESLPPYALFQDLPIGDYMGEEFVVGEYSVSSVPYSGNGMAGDMGTSLTLNFELIDGDPVCSDFDVSVLRSEDPGMCDGFGGVIELLVQNFQGPLTFMWDHDSTLNGPLAQNLSAGSYMVRVMDINYCMMDITVTLNDPEPPVVTLAPLMSVLDTEAAFSLTGGMPAGGDYTGPGVTNCVFDPQAVGPGVYDITYTYEHPSTFCSASATQSIVVKAESFNIIIAFWLVNADSEEDLFEITDGMQIDIDDLPTNNLDIRAETGGETESVGFELSGTQSIMRGESLPPYALFQDLPVGDFIGHEFDLGAYTLSGTPYLQNSLQGDAGETLTIDFEFVDSTPTLAVTGFTLIDADTDDDLFDLTDGMEIFLDDIPSLFLDIRANTTDDVESVRLELTGQQSSGRTESLVPYALFRDLPIGDYMGNNFEFGTYTVTATPYSGNNMSGEMGTPLSITFEIVDDLELNTLKISPNQATTLAKASFDRPTEVKQILIFDMSGRMIESYNPKYIKSGDDYILDVNFYQQGTYIVKMFDNRGVPYQKQMVVKRQ